MVEESADHDSEEQSSNGCSPGEILAQAREEKGLSRLRTSELLGLTQGAVRDIELCRFDKFPSGIYTRGYIRNYSKLVGADEMQVLAAYDRYGETHEIPEEAPFGHSTTEPAEPPGKKRTLFIVISILIALVLIYFIFR